MSNVATAARMHNKLRPSHVSASFDNESSIKEQFMPYHRMIAFHDFRRHDDLQVSVFILNGSALTRSALSLLRQAYTRLGYSCDGGNTPEASSVNLQAAVNDQVVGTLSITFNSKFPIRAEELYAKEIAPYHVRGKICEFTRLAVDPAVGGCEVLCSLFYIAYVYSHLVHGATDLFVEVNPRHVRFYKQLLGFEQLGEVKQCARVNAPAVLLHLDFRHTALQIERSRIGMAVDASKLYKHAAPLEQEQVLIEQIIATTRRSMPLL